FEYQSMVCELTGLEVSTASLYDGPTAVVEAAHMATSATGRSKVMVGESVDPRYLQTLRTYSAGEHFDIRSIPAANGVTALGQIPDDAAAAVVQHPNAWGNLEPAREPFESARASGARAIQVFDPLPRGL